MKKTKIWENNKKDILLSFFLTTAIFIRYIVYDFKYYYQLDDYIQYWLYPSSAVKWDVVREQGLLASRPLAGICDLYLWSGFFENMIFAVFIISVLYALSAVLFLKIFRKYFGTGFMFVIFYSLMPYFFEGAYWVSASTRIVVGLFFTALSLWSLQKLLDGRGGKYYVIYPLSQLISICFYEQTLILSVAVNMGIILINAKENRKNLTHILPIAASGLIYLVVTKFLSGSGTSLSGRMSIRLPEFTESYLQYLQNIFNQIKVCFVELPQKIMTTGFLRGISLIFKDGLWLFTVAASLTGVAAAVFACGDSVPKQKKRIKMLIFSLIITILPISLFFILSNPYFCMRNILPSYVGIAIILDMAVRVITFDKKIIKGIFAGILVFVCTVSSLSEIYDYKLVYDFDTKVVGAMADINLKDGDKYSTGYIIPGEEKGELCVKYHERGSGVISSDWATSGMLIYSGGRNITSRVQPIETQGNVFHTYWDREAKDLSTFEKLYYWENNGFTEVFFRKTGETTGELTLADGSIFAGTEEKDYIGYIYK